MVPAWIGSRSPPWSSQFGASPHRTAGGAGGGGGAAGDAPLAGYNLTESQHALLEDLLQKEESSIGGAGGHAASSAPSAHTYRPPMNPIETYAHNA